MWFTLPSLGWSPMTVSTTQRVFLCLELLSWPMERRHMTILFILVMSEQQISLPATFSFTTMKLFFQSFVLILDLSETFQLCDIPVPAALTFCFLFRFSLSHFLVSSHIDREHYYESTYSPFCFHKTLSQKIFAPSMLDVCWTTWTDYMLTFSAFSSLFTALIHMDSSKKKKKIPQFICFRSQRNYFPFALFPLVKMPYSVMIT